MAAPWLHSKAGSPDSQYKVRIVAHGLLAFSAAFALVKRRLSTQQPSYYPTHKAQVIGYHPEFILAGQQT